MDYLNQLNFKNKDVSSLIDFFRKGNKIHIKKKNRGKFTEYCGGEVTGACIQRAKKSGNKKLIKRAVFAENSRKWSKT